MNSSADKRNNNVNVKCIKWKKRMEMFENRFFLS